MTMTNKELEGMLEEHSKWLQTRHTDKVDGKRLELYGEDLEGASLKGCYLNYANFRGANLAGVNLSGAYLVGANLEGCDLTGANLKGADVTNVNLSGAKLFGADLNIRRASPFVYDALSAVAAAQICLKKTEIDWIGDVMN